MSRVRTLVDYQSQISDFDGDGTRDLNINGSITAGGLTSPDVPKVDLTIAPEVLEIQVDAPAAGQDTAWLWTWEQSTLPYARRTITNSPEVSVPLYKQGQYVVNNFAAYDVHGSMTQTHTLYFKWIDGAGTDNLISWATSAGPISDTHPDINSGAATDVQRITVNVPATVTPPTLTAPNVSYTVTNNANGAYTFSGSAAGDNPNLGPMYRGGTYTFNINASGHPLYLTTDNGSNFSAGTYFGEYTTGVTGSRTDSGTLTITIDANAPDTLYYQCGNHSSMRGAITIKDLAVETNINGNYVVYAMHTQEGHKTPVELRPIPSLVNQMCIVYDNSVNKFVPQDLATYVENTPSFENKIREVAGTAELVVEDGSAVVAKVNVYDDSTYLPLTGNNAGDQAFATDTNILYIWDGSAWQQAGTTNTNDLTEGSNNLFYTDARVDARVALVVDAAPAQLDTLNELSAALNDDANFGTTVTNSLATKAPIDNPTFTGVVTGDGSGLTGVPSGISRHQFTATANQTTFSVTYTSPNVDVFKNGVKLVRVEDYTDTSGTDIVLTSGAQLNDNIEINTYQTYTVPDTVAASTGGTFAGPVTTDSLTVNGQITGDQNHNSDPVMRLDGLNGAMNHGRYGHTLIQNKNNSTSNWWGLSPRDGGNLEISYGAPNAYGSLTAGAKMAFTTDGKVGINIDTPETTLDVHTTSAATYGAMSGGSSYIPSSGDIIQVKNNNTGTDDHFAGIWFETGVPASNSTGSNRTGRLAYVVSNNTGYGGHFAFQTRGTNAILDERMRIHQDGIITKPGQPSFCATRGVDLTYTTTGDSGALAFDTIKHNIGNHYNNSNYRFTAPVDGSYQFNMHLRIDNIGSGYTWFRMYKNGSYFGDNGAPGSITQQSGSYHSLNCSSTIYLVAGDYVDARVYVSADANWDLENASYFSGFLVG